MLFTPGNTPRSSMIAGRAIPHHPYGDDSQLNVFFVSRDSSAALNGLQLCLASAHSRASSNKVKLNPDKTELLLTGNERQRRKDLSVFPIELFGVKTNPAKSARTLETIFDKNVTFRSYISAVCSSCFYHMRDEKQPAYLHTILATSLPYTPIGISRSGPMVKTNTFHSYAPFLCSSLQLAVRSAISVATFKKHLNIHLTDVAFPT